MKRHSSALKKLLNELSSLVLNLKKESYSTELQDLLTFLNAFTEGLPVTEVKNLNEKYPVRYKYTTDNPDAVKPGAKVLDPSGKERFIVEASDKSIRLEGDADWINVSEVRFSS